MHRLIAILACAALLAAAGAASAAVTVYEHEDADGFRFNFAAGESPISTFVVTSTPRTLIEFGVDMQLKEEGDIKFVIIDSDTSTLLFSSTKHFDTSAGFKNTDPISFVIAPGIAYALGAIANVDSDRFLDATPNDLGDLIFFANSFALLDFTTPTMGDVAGIFDVGTRLVVDAADVPEPLTLTLLGAGLAGLTLSRRRRA